MVHVAVTGPRGHRCGHRATLTNRIDGIEAATLRQARAIVEAGSAIGKAVLVAR